MSFSWFSPVSISCDFHKTPVLWFYVLYLVFLFYIVLSSESYLTKYNSNWVPSWSWSHGGWIYYLCNQCLTPLKLLVRTPFMARCTPYSIEDYVIMFVIDLRRVTQWFSPGTRVSSINKTDHHDVTDILF